MFFNVSSRLLSFLKKYNQVLLLKESFSLILAKLTTYDAIIVQVLLLKPKPKIEFSEFLIWIP